MAGWTEDWLGQVMLGMESSGMVVRRESSGLAVTAMSGEDFDPPVWVQTTESSLVAHLDAMAADALDVFPDVQPRRAAFQLLLTHLDETFATAVVGGSQIWFTDGLLHIDPRRPPESRPDLGGERGDVFYWSADRPSG